MSTDTTSSRPDGLPSEPGPADAAEPSTGKRKHALAAAVRSGWIAAAALVLAVAAGGAAGFLAVSFTGDARSRTAALENRVADLDARVAAFAEEVGAAGALAGPVDDLERRIGGAEDMLAALEARTGSAVESAVAGIEDEVAELRGLVDGLQQSSADGAAADPAIVARLSDLDRAIGDRDDRIEALSAALAAVEARAADPLAGFVLAVGQLRAVADSGAPFAEPLAVARRLAPDDDVLAGAFGVLERHAEAGVATAGALEAEMAAAFADAVAAEAVDKADGWFDKTLARLEGLVSVRRTDGAPEGVAAPAVTGRARAHVEAGDVAAALAELEALAAPAAAEVAGWRARAEAHAAVRSALRALAARAATLVGGAGG